MSITRSRTCGSLSSSAGTATSVAQSSGTPAAKSFGRSRGLSSAVASMLASSTAACVAGINRRRATTSAYDEKPAIETTRSRISAVVPATIDK